MLIQQVLILDLLHKLRCTFILTKPLCGEEYNVYIYIYIFPNSC